MADGRLRVACRRHDWTAALFDGRAGAASIDIAPHAHLDLAQLSASDGVDFMEAGLNAYYQARCDGAPILALPVFLRAAFRHNYIFVRSDGPIAAPADLEGRRVATRYGMTANVWARALLQHQYGVRLERIRWVNAEDAAPSAYKLPPGTAFESIGAAADPAEMLLRGEVDAIVHPDVIPTKLMAQGTVRRLFADAAAEERAYYRATKIVPVMNVVAFRADDALRRPGDVAAVFDAFRRAKALGLDAMQDTRGSGLLWYYEALETQLELLGPDPVPYSVEAMRTTLTAYIRFALEHGVASERLPLESLFWEPVEAPA